MSLHEELASGSLPACLLCRYMTTLAPSEQTEWTVELREPVTVVGNTAVVKALKRRGVDISEAAVRRHRSNHLV